MTDRTYRHTYQRSCQHCGKRFSTWNKSARYCSGRCRTDAATARRDRAVPNHWRTTERPCRLCGSRFLPGSPNRRYCSVECSAKARRADLDRFKRENPDAQSLYNRNRHGGKTDTVWRRVQRRYPDLPIACEAVGCGEARIVEIAHKPEHRRNGAWRTMDRYERHMFWVLCPTHHRLLDSGIEMPEKMGLR